MGLWLDSFVPMIFMFRHGMVTNYERAIRNGDLKTVTTILNKDKRMSMQPWGPWLGGKYPIHVAATYGQVNVMKKLLNAGAKPGVPDKDGKTALILAAEKGHGSIVRLLAQNVRTIKQRKELAQVLLQYLDYKSSPQTIDVLAKSGVFKVPYVLDYILQFDRATALGIGTIRRALCRIYNNHGVKLTDAQYPFHILIILIEDECHLDRLDSTTKITRTVNHLIKKGYNVNSKFKFKYLPIEVHKKNGQTPMDLLSQYMFTKRDILNYENPDPSGYMKEKKSTIHKLQHLYHVLSSRGAKRSTWSKNKKMKQQNKITSWSDDSKYQNIQNLRRRQPSPISGSVYPYPQYTRNMDQAKQFKAVYIDRHMAQVFRNTAIRAPVVPLKYSHTKFLYRGVHDWQAEQLLQSGKLDIRSYIAFSRSRGIAFNFAAAGNIGVLMRLRIEDVPKGTPWIWFDHSNYNNDGHKINKTYSKNVYRSLVPNEEEVLLPPGELTLSTRLHNSTTNGSSVQFYEVEYTPNKNSKSLEGKRLYRSQKQSAAQASEQNENAALSWYMAMFNIQDRKRKRNVQ
jgi:hypothetical protein